MLSDCDTNRTCDGEVPGEAALETTGDGGTGVVFWLLISLSVAGFAPCMILPAWRDYQQAEVTQQARATQVAGMTSEIEALRRRLDAIHNDPAVVARLARRELAFRLPGESVVDVPVRHQPQPPPSQSEAATDTSMTTSLPLPLARLATYLPDVGYDRLFCQSPAREIILVMSLGMFVAAFVIFWPKQ